MKKLGILALPPPCTASVLSLRLREPGYLADSPDGILGPRCQKAMQLFQSENSFPVGDNADRETLRLLDSSDAARCCVSSSIHDRFWGGTLPSGDRFRKFPPTISPNPAINGTNSPLIASNQ